MMDADPQPQAHIEMALIDAHFERKIEVVATAAAGIAMRLGTATAIAAQDATPTAGTTRPTPA